MQVNESLDNLTMFCNVDEVTQKTQHTVDGPKLTKDSIGLSLVKPRGGARSRWLEEADHDGTRTTGKNKGWWAILASSVGITPWTKLCFSCGWIHADLRKQNPFSIDSGLSLNLWIFALVVALLVGGHLSYYSWIVILQHFLNITLFSLSSSDHIHFDDPVLLNYPLVNPMLATAATKPVSIKRWRYVFM